MQPPARIHRVVVAFELPPEVPHRLLTAATEGAQARAREALPAEGLVRAEGSLAAGREGRRRARFELSVSGASAEASWGPLAQDAFAEAFLAALAAKGHEARRVA